MLPVPRDAAEQDRFVFTPQNLTAAAQKETMDNCPDKVGSDFGYRGYRLESPLRDHFPVFLSLLEPSQTKH